MERIKKKPSWPSRVSRVMTVGVFLATFCSCTGRVTIDALGGRRTSALLTPTGSVLRLENRTALANRLNGIFGDSANSVTSKLIAPQIAAFGGACDGYSGNSPQDPGDCSAVSQTQTAAIPLSITPSEALNTRACQQIVGQGDAAVLFARAQAQGHPQSGAPMSYPTVEDLQGAYALFFPGRAVPRNVLVAFQSLVSQVKSGGDGPIEAWRFVLLTLCYAPDGRLT